MPTWLSTRRPARGRATRRSAIVTIVLLVAFAATCVALWTLTASVLPGTHSENEVEQLTPDVAEEEGVGQALSDLHGHLNWVIWGRGELDEAEWGATLQATVAVLQEQGRTDIATELERAGQLLDADARLHQVHDQLEAVESRLANTTRDEDAAAPGGPA